MTFDRLIHSDWSQDDRGRATAVATRTASGWQVGHPRATGDLRAFFDTICQPDTLAGFDFPIGLPKRFGVATGLSSFPIALTRFGEDEWSDFFRVADRPDQISPRRPFYPNRAGGTLQSHLLEGLCVSSMDHLLRECERATMAGRSNASSLFWTMGPKQVGKAAITGWRDVLRPARLRGCRLWPFDGDLAMPGPIIAETYPAEAYAHVGIVSKQLSKEKPASRANCAPTLFDWASRSGVAFTAELATSIETGFAAFRNGSDHFDALIGLFGMIEVVEGRRPDAPPGVDRVWEGWILGQQG